MVSIVMPAWKASTTIAEALESVIAQTYVNWELIVVAEDEESAKIAEGYRDGRMRILRNKCQLGVAKSRNRGIREATGEYLAFIDADDLWREDKLEKQVAIGADISFTASAFIDSQGKPFKYILHVPEKLSYSDLLKRNLMSSSSVMVKRAIMQPFPALDKPVHEDYVSWMRILRGRETIDTTSKKIRQNSKERFAIGLDEPLLIYRLQRNSKSGNRLRSCQMTFNAYREVGYGKVKSVILTIQYAKWSIEKRSRIYGSSNN